MNRHERRIAAKAKGVPWPKHREAVKFVQQAQRMEAAGLKMTPEQAREALARWAAVGGNVPVAEIEREETLVGVTLKDLQQ